MRKWINLCEVRAYHGSQSNDAFIIGHTGNNSAGILGQYDSKRHGVFFTDNPEFASMYGTVKQYELNIHHTVDLDKSNIIHEFRNSLDQFDRNGGRELWLEAMYGCKQAWRFFENEVGENFVRYLLEEGYDSATFTEYNEEFEKEHKSHTIVVFDPSLISPV